MSDKEIGAKVKPGDKAMWVGLSDNARAFLLQMSVFIISIKRSFEDIEIWNSYFIQTLRYWGMKIKVLSNPCAPQKKIAQDTGAVATQLRSV